MIDKQSLTDASVVLWILDNQFVTEKGLKVEFVNHRWAIDYLNDDTRHKVTPKAAQAGMTFLEFLDDIHLVGKRGLEVAHSFHTDAILQKIVKPKLNPLIMNNPAIRQMMTVDSEGLKGFGNSFLHVIGANSESNAISFSADVLKIDEKDRCFSNNVSILTKAGWKSIIDLTTNDEVFSRTDDGTGVFVRPREVIRLDYDGDEYTFKGKHTDISVTANHKMLVNNKLVKAKDLYGTKFELQDDVENGYESPDVIEFPAMTILRRPRGSSLLPEQTIRFKAKRFNAIAWYQFLGWYIAEGALEYRKRKDGSRRLVGTIVIGQKKLSQVQEIISCIKRLGMACSVYVDKTGCSRIVVNNLHLAGYLEELGKQPDRYIPHEWLWTGRLLLRALMDALMKGDGDDRGVYSTTSKQLADDVQILALMCGYSAVITDREVPGYHRKYMVTISRRTFRRFNGYKGSSTSATVTKSHYTGSVYCVNVPPYHTIMVRSGTGWPVWSGNSNLSVVEMLESRLKASQVRYIREFSNPSSIGVGVDATWQISDQKHWIVKCSFCNHRSWIDFEPAPDRRPQPHYVDKVSREYVCGKCSHVITNRDRIQGEWVARYPGREIHGYWISQMMCCWISARDIMDDYESKSTEYFYNFVLGKAYTPSDLLISRETILRACVPSMIPKLGVAMGVDQKASEMEWVAGTAQGIFAYGRAKSWEEIEMLKLQWGAVVVADGRPYPTGPAMLARKYSDFYVALGKQISTMDVLTYSPDGKTIYYDRVKLLDIVAHEITEMKLLFRMRPYELEDYIGDWLNIYRTTVEEPDGRTKSDWLKKENKESDYPFATGYYRIALTKVMSQGSSTIVEPDLSHRVPTTDTADSRGNVMVETIGEAFKATMDQFD